MRLIRVDEWNSEHPLRPVGHHERIVPHGISAPHPVGDREMHFALQYAGRLKTTQLHLERAMNIHPVEAAKMMMSQPVTDMYPRHLSVFTPDRDIRNRLHAGCDQVIGDYGFKGYTGSPKYDPSTERAFKIHHNPDFRNYTLHAPAADCVVMDDGTLPAGSLRVDEHPFPVEFREFRRLFGYGMGHPFTPLMHFYRTVMSRDMFLYMDNGWLSENIHSREERPNRL